MADNEIVVTILGKDMTTSALRSVGMNLRSMGREVAQVGLAMSAAITLPLTLFAKGLNTFGKDASDQLTSMQGNVDSAIAKVADARAQMSQDSAAATAKANDQLQSAKLALTDYVDTGGKSALRLRQLQENVTKATQEVATAGNVSTASLKAANAQYTQAVAALNNMSPAIKKAADSYNQLKAAMKPVNDALDTAKAEILTGIVPVVQQLAPIITKLVTGVANLAHEFSALPTSTKDIIIGFLAIAAAAGPLLIGLGTVLKVGGDMILLYSKLAEVDLLVAEGAPKLAAGLQAIGAGGWAALGPILAVVGAVALLGKVIADNINLIRALFDILSGNTGDLKNVKADTGALSVMKLMPNTVGNVMFPGTYGNQAATPAATTGGLSADDQAAIYAKIKAGSGKAMGGPVGQGTYLVGERGPELLTMGGSGYITPNSQLQGVNLIFNYSPTMSLATRSEAENIITPAILSILHKRGIA